MIEELLLTYQARQQVTGKRTDLLDHPGIVDSAFKSFLTENDFIYDVETLLTTFLKSSESSTGGAVSFIAVDIDNQSTLASQYGDRIARNLSREVGMLLRKHLNLFAEFANKRLYHIYADRYYLLLDGMSLEDARTNAEQIRIALQGRYIIDSQRSSEKSRLPNEVTVRLGVTSYTYQKIKEILQRYDANTAVAEFRALITQGLDLVLDKGRREGGNVIITWDYTLGGYRKWKPDD